MSAKKTSFVLDYARLLGRIKDRIRQSQVRAVFSVNAELVRLYWDTGRILEEQQEREGYGTAVIPRLARDLRNELPEVKGFSERNIGRMIAFSRAYPRPAELLPQAVAKPSPAEGGPQAVTGGEGAGSLLWLIPWGHHAVLLEKVKDPGIRLWYMRQTLLHGWSRNVLSLMIGSDAHSRQGKAISNFPDRLPPAQSDLVVQSLKDPYVFDFLTLEEPFHERELETGLLHHLERFLLELGQGFAFVGRQYRLEVGDEDFYVDLIFYHLRLRCFVVIDLKKGAFKAEYAGKMSFYLNVVDDKLRHPTDASSIGLILCQDRNRVVAEYALRGLNKPIGVSEYELTRSLPRELESSLPTIEAIEAELAEPAPERPAPKKVVGKKEGPSHERKRRRVSPALGLDVEDSGDSPRTKSLTVGGLPILNDATTLRVDHRFPGGERLMDLYVGTSGYSYKPWKGSFYPSNLPDRQMLRYYGERFRTVEINSTFYGMPKASTLEGWANEVPGDFKFVLKAPKQITHGKKFDETGDLVSRFLEIAGVLTEHQGPLLFQLPPTTKKDVSRLRAFLELLPLQRRKAMEFRHVSWFDDEVFGLMREHRAALCVADAEGDLEVPFVATADWGYLRLRRPDYGDPELREWVKRVREQGWSEAFVFFKHEDEGKGPRMAKRYLELAADT